MIYPRRLLEIVFFLVFLFIVVVVLVLVLVIPLFIRVTKKPTGLLLLLPTYKSQYR
jgi:hypothetical protein